MMKAAKDLEALLSPHYPGLLARIREAIEASERRTAPHTHPDAESFLWEHTVQVAATAGKISREEGMDPLIPVLVALFHDTGKFAGGQYHADDTPEEISAASQAREILSSAKVEMRIVDRVVTSLRALYDERQTENREAGIVHDADFLSKMGLMGVASFITKTTLRGRALQSSLTESLSKELTYSASLPENMRTASGKRMASRKKRDTLTFYRGLLDELRESGIASFKIQEEAFTFPQAPRKPISLLMVVPEACLECDGKLSLDFKTLRGKKCEMLAASIRCEACSKTYEVSFCLPEIRRDRGEPSP